MAQLGPVASRWGRYVEFLTGLPQPVVGEAVGFREPADGRFPHQVVEGVTAELDARRFHLVDIS